MLFCPLPCHSPSLVIPSPLLVILRRSRRIRPPVPLIFHRPVPSTRKKQGAGQKPDSLFSVILRKSQAVSYCISWRTPWGTWFAWASSSQAPYPSLRRRRQSSFTSLLLLSPRDPLRWARVGSRSGGHAVPGGTTITPSQAVSYCISCRTPWGT